ncbi:MAG: hypothetical protein WCJ30_13605, partial [Deltaproteobacteria bacterium]
MLALIAIVLAVVVGAWPRAAYAHQASTSCVTLAVEGRDATIEVRLASEDLGEPSGLSPLV